MKNTNCVCIFHSVRRLVRRSDFCPISAIAGITTMFRMFGISEEKIPRVLFPQKLGSLGSGDVLVIPMHNFGKKKNENFSLFQYESEVQCTKRTPVSRVPCGESMYCTVLYSVFSRVIDYHGCAGNVVIFVGST